MERLDTSPVSSSQICSWTDNDPILARVKTWVQSGWPTQENDEAVELRPYTMRRYEFSVEEGCLLWGESDGGATEG